jgi:hypothetical protein
MGYFKHNAEDHELARVTRCWQEAEADLCEQLERITAAERKIEALETALHSLTGTTDLSALGFSAFGRPLTGTVQ